MRGPLLNSSNRPTDADNKAQAPDNAAEMQGEQIRKMKARKAKRAKIPSYLLLLCRMAVIAMIAATCLYNGLFGGAAAIPAPNGGPGDVLFLSLQFSVLLCDILSWLQLLVVCAILGRLLWASLCIAVRAIRWLFTAHENLDIGDAVPPNPQVLLSLLTLCNIGLIF